MNIALEKRKILNGTLSRRLLSSRDGSFNRWFGSVSAVVAKANLWRPPIVFEVTGKLLLLLLLLLLFDVPIFDEEDTPMLGLIA